MQSFPYICKFCNELNVKLVCQDKSKTLNGILPGDFCPLAFHSIYPYMLTLLNGGWFNWVGYNDNVIVNCPCAQGIAMYVKAPLKGASDKIGIEIMKTNPLCYKRYNLKDDFNFDFSSENNVWFKMLDSLVPIIFNKDIGNQRIVKMSCMVDDRRIFYHMELNGAHPG